MYTPNGGRSRYLPAEWVPRVWVPTLLDYSAQLPGGQALGWTMEGSSTDKDQGSTYMLGLLGILTDLIHCKQPE